MITEVVIRFKLDSYLLKIIKINIIIEVYNKLWENIYEFSLMYAHGPTLKIINTLIFSEKKLINILIFSA